MTTITCGFLVAIVISMQVVDTTATSVRNYIACGRELWSALDLVCDGKYQGPKKRTGESPASCCSGIQCIHPLTFDLYLRSQNCCRPMMIRCSRTHQPMRTHWILVNISTASATCTTFECDALRPLSMPRTWSSCAVEIRVRPIHWNNIVRFVRAVGRGCWTNDDIHLMKYINILRVFGDVLFCIQFECTESPKTVELGDNHMTELKSNDAHWIQKLGCATFIPNLCTPFQVNCAGCFYFNFIIVDDILWF